jgi:hypothetical protein
MNDKFNLQKGTATSVRLDPQQLKINEKYQITQNKFKVKRQALTIPE